MTNPKVPSTAGQLAIPDWDKRNAFAAAYFETGNQDKAMVIAGVHRNTAMKWKAEAWFDKALKELKRAGDKHLDGHITKILAKTLVALEERIDSGDEKVLITKEGVFRAQQKLTAKDLAIVTGVLFDKRTAIRREPEDDTQAESALDRIAEKLRQYSLTEKLAGKGEVVDVESITGEDLC